MPPHAVNIGTVTIKNNIFLAPMAGVTDYAFRLICRGFGCGLTYSEMVSAKSVIFGNVHTKRLMDAHESDSPRSVQLFGHEPEDFSEAIKRLEGEAFDIADINMGCPVLKIVKNGDGSALMNNPPLAGRIIEAAVRASARPVTVKIRKGFSRGNANAAEMAKVAEESGAAAIAVHGRTREQFYAGEADWDCVAEVKSAVRIPVIGNGDVNSPEAAAKMLSYTGCDAVMAGRGAMGDPWLFERILHYLETETKLPPPSAETRLALALSHLRLTAEQKGERVGVQEMRKHMSWYVKGLASASALRKLINSAQTVEEMEQIVQLSAV